jgi:hypothetical protein
VLPPEGITVKDKHVVDGGAGKAFQQNGFADHAGGAGDYYVHGCFLGRLYDEPPTDCDQLL